MRGQPRGAIDLPDCSPPPASRGTEHDVFCCAHDPSDIFSFPQRAVARGDAMKYLKTVLFPFLATAALMTLYQVGKFYLFEGHYTIWQSHIMTIFFTSLIATTVSVSMVNWVERIERSKREVALREARLKTLQITMHTVHHIVNNFLNRLLLFKLETEERGTISTASLEKLEADISAISKQLAELSELENPENVDEFDKFFPMKPTIKERE
jgi:hypothetical protein